MKKILALLFCLIPLGVSAQNFLDDFQANNLGWNVYYGDNYMSTIQNGLMHLETKEGAKDAMVTCYSSLDTNKPFELEIKLMKTKINDEQRGIGIVFNYKDDLNFDVFYLMKGSVLYRKIVDSKIVGQRRASVDLNEKLKDHELLVKYYPGNLHFFVNGVDAIEINYATLEYSGIGIAVWAEDGKQSADVDYIKYRQ